MRIFRKVIFLLITLVIFANLNAEETKEIKDLSKKRIGVYDSRAIAIAFAGSKKFEEWMKNIKKQFNKTDQSLVLKLQAEASARRKFLAKLASGKAPIDKLFEEGKLEKIKENENVSEFISKWNKIKLEKYQSSEKVDLTLTLIDALHSKGKFLKEAKEIMKIVPGKTKKLKKE